MPVVTAMKLPSTSRVIEGSACVPCFSSELA
jgi:hypothetical protein